MPIIVSKFPFLLSDEYTMPIIAQWKFAFVCHFPVSFAQHWEQFLAIACDYTLYYFQLFSIVQ